MTRLYTILGAPLASITTDQAGRMEFLTSATELLIQIIIAVSSLVGLYITWKNRP